MIGSVELQVISKILATDNQIELDTLLEYDESFYSVFKEHIIFIQDHRLKYGDIPDVFTFQAQFPDVTLIKVTEPLTYLVRELKKNKQQILLVETFNKLKDLGSSDVTDAWTYLSKQCEKSEELSDSRPLNLVSDAKQRAQQVLEFSHQTRIPTGFPEIDKIMYGGLSTVEELVIILARTNTGKAQPLWSPVLTPNGWTTMGELKIGDTVVGKNNDNGKVIKIFPQGAKDYYKVTFDDNTSTYACDDHLWEVLDQSRRCRDNKHYQQYEVLTTKELRHNISKNYTIDISDPIEFDVPFDETNELDPYLLGLIIGDGSLRDNRVNISNNSEELWSYIEDIISKYECKRSGNLNQSIRGNIYGKNFVRKKIIEYGLLDVKSIDKFIPKQFLTAPVSVRKQLLAGLLDTDGYALNNRPSWEFDTASEQLAMDFTELARSLGVYVKLHDRKPSSYTKNGVRYEGNGSRHITCRSIFNPFKLSIKSSKYSYRDSVINRSALRRHAKKIMSIEYAGQTECQCILLDNKSHTYLTNDYIVTHNSWVCTKMMATAQINGFPVLYYSPEMQSSYLGTRFDTWKQHFKNNQLMQGNYTKEYIEYIDNLSNEPTGAYVLEDKDVSGESVNVKTIATLVKKHNIKLVIVDGLSYLEDSKHADKDHNRYKNICLDLFKMSKQYGCAVVVAMQANRDTKNIKDDKGDPIPTLFNAESSDHPGRICTQAFALRQVFDKHVLDIRLEKSRNAANQKPVFSYSWDVNTGNVQYIPGDDDMTTTQEIIPTVVPSSTVSTEMAFSDDLDADTNFDIDEDIEF